MRKLNEQWIENGMMYKAVVQESKIVNRIIDGNICHGCCHVDNWDDDCLHPSKLCPLDKGLIIKDLGPVNEEGLPLCPFCKGYPELESEENWEGRDIWFVECAECGARTDEYLEEAEAVDAWKRRV